MTQKMMPMSLNGREVLPGFRLKRLEVLNWGTFHGTIHRIIPDGRWTLLVGDNGSGKSTTADALRTLLVPPGKLSYNDASIDHKLKQVRKDRTRVSYIRGAYGAISQQDSSVPIVQHHRDEGVLTALLAVFVNEVGQVNVTLAQLLWVESNKPKELYLVARDNKSIKDHLTGLSVRKDMKKELRRRGFEVFESFTAYEERFRQLLGIPGAGALEVFNQVIGVKEVTDLNQFIRKHMLEPTETRDYIATHIKPHYEKLNACWEAIKRAEDQLLLLNPIAKKYEDWEKAKSAHADWELVQSRLPHYYNQRQLEMRLAFDEELEEKINQLRDEQEKIQTEQTSTQQKRDSLNLAIESDAVGGRLKDIARDLEIARQERDRRLAALGGLRKQMVDLQQTFPLESEAQFKAMRHKLLTDKGPLEGNLETQDKKKMQHYLAKEQAENARKALAVEAQAVRDSGALIPSKLLVIRRQICQATGVAEKDLPFAGELIEVEAKYKEWTGAIEKLLHGFGTSLLVDERNYRQVAAYINSNYLGTRLVFHQVPSTFTPARPELLNDASRVPARLQFQEESPFSRWLKAEVVRRFSHPCCDRVDQLRDLNYGITLQGLIKDGTRHVKDDNFRIGDRTQYVLGWSTQAKLAALSEELEKLILQFQDHDKKYHQAVENLKGLSTKVAALKAILEIEEYESINARPIQEQMSQLQAEKVQLEKSSNQITELQRQLQEVEQSLSKLNQKLEDKTLEIGGFDKERKENAKKITSLRQDLEGVNPEFEASRERILQVQAEKKLTLENLEKTLYFVSERIREKLDNFQDQMNTAQRSLLPAMQRFLTAYPQERATLIADMDYGPEFVKLKNDIDGEELPAHKERFFSLLNSKLIMEMAAFNMKLVQDEKAIRDRIESVNRTLRHTKFSKHTYVHIRITPANSDEIRVFRAKLKSCLARGIQPEQSELQIIYENIRGLISEFEKSPEWTARVTDVRNWIDYGVQELNEADGAEVQYFSMSSGKSGGQKTILAFTIMASAITSQYGLTGEGDDIGRFRLVLVDEAFAKTDPDNSQRTLELFKTLGLQLVIINPWDAKSRIVEDYVDTYHLANTNQESQLSSLTRATRERYLEVRKERDASKETHAHSS